MFHKTDDRIKVYHEKLPQSVPWHTTGVQYVVEASGMFTNLEKASVSTNLGTRLKFNTSKPRLINPEVASFTLLDLLKL